MSLAEPPTMPGPPDLRRDAATVSASLREPAAFAALFDRHWPAIRAYCVSRSGPAGEDLAAETFRVAFDRRASFDPHLGEAGPWLYGIATNLIRDSFRRGTRSDRAHRRWGRLRSREGSGDLLEQVEAAQLGPELAMALRRTSPDDRDALLLHAWADLSYERIATATGVPVGTVRSRIHRARRALRAELSTPSSQRSSR